MMLSERTVLPRHEREHDQPVLFDFEFHDKEYADLFLPTDMLTKRHRAGEFFLVNRVMGDASMTDPGLTSNGNRHRRFSMTPIATIHGE